MRGLGVQGLLCIAIFMFVLIMGLAYAWKKGALKWE
jgi:NADH-quinone oxidoreductase subunit A